eukprot:5530879-Amphidinium_carterae.1
MASVANSEGSMASSQVAHTVVDDSWQGSGGSSSTSPRSHQEEQEEAASVASDAPDRRKQFLHRLAEGLGELPRMELPSRKGLAAGAAPPAPCAGTEQQDHAYHDASVMAEDPPSLSAELGPSFFAGVEALQRRMAQRRLSTKMRAASSPGEEASAAGATTMPTSPLTSDAVPKQARVTTPPA